MRNFWLLLGCCCSLIVLTIGLAGCQVAVPNQCGPCGYHDHYEQRHFHQHQHHQPRQRACPCDSGCAVQPTTGAMTMPLQVEPTELLPRALTGVAKLIAATEQFQIETGKTEDASLLQHCRWPEIRQGTYAGQQATSPDPLTAPLAIVSMEPNSGSELLSRAYRDIADGELFVQLALVENGNYAANEDRWNDAANRFGAIMRQMLELGASRISNRWQVTRWAMHQPPELNNLQKFPFVKLVGDELVEVRVWVFPAVVTWVG